MRLVSPDGRWFPVRCSRRACPHCGRLADFEDATALFLDARVQQPTVAITLTTVQPWEQLDPAVYREASAQLWRELRARWGRVEYVGLIEFTTGLSERSGGHRRMHGHYLVKGLDPRDVLEIERVARTVWERVTGAYVVEVAELRSAGGAIAYMGLHHRKPEQAAPAAWRGMRLRASKRYWHRPIADLREQARSDQAWRRMLWHVRQDLGEDAPDWMVEFDANERMSTSAGAWSVVKVREGAVVTPLGPLESADPPRLTPAELAAYAGALRAARSVSPRPYLPSTAPASPATADPPPRLSDPARGSPSPA